MEELLKALVDEYEFLLNQRSQAIDRLKELNQTAGNFVEKDEAFQLMNVLHGKVQGIRRAIEIFEQHYHGT